MENIDASSQSVDSLDDVCSEQDVSMIDQDTTIKYLQGEIPFAEFQSMLEQHIKDEVDQKEHITPEDVSNVEITTTPTSDPQPSTSMRQSVPKKRIEKIPVYAQGLLGEANMNVARGNHQEAIKMCMEVIRLAPNASQPYSTMSAIYEEINDHDKSLQFALIAAHLRPSDVEQWLRTADMALEGGNQHLASKCYSKIARYSHNDPKMLTMSLEYFQSIHDEKKSMEIQHLILGAMTAAESHQYMEFARDLAKRYHAKQEKDRAIDIMTQALHRHPTAFKLEDVNYLVEWWMEKGQHSRSLYTFSVHCGVCLLTAEGPWPCVSDMSAFPVAQDKVPTIVSCEIPSSMAIDLCVKCMVCLISSGNSDSIRSSLHHLTKLSPEIVGDLYLDVAEAYMNEGQHRSALTLLASLVTSEKYDLAAVWLRFAECHQALGNRQQAINAYQRVTQLAPLHSSARISLSALYQQQGQADYALKVLGFSEKATPSSSDLQLLRPRSMLLLSEGKLAEFVECAQLLLFGPLLNDSELEEVISVFKITRFVRFQRRCLIEKLGKEFEAKARAYSIWVIDSGMASVDRWELQLKLCQVLRKLKKVKEMVLSALYFVICTIYANDTQILESANYLLLQCCLYSRNSQLAYNFIRELCLSHMVNSQVWNIFNRVVSHMEDIRHSRFLIRLMSKNPEHPALGLLNAHNALCFGTYKQALGEYVRAMRSDAGNPLLSLMVSVTLMQMACQKCASQRHNLAIQATCFLNQYVELRGQCQESYYNFGRAMHRLGLLHAAVHYYEKALEFPCAISDDPQSFDLKYEIASNLCLVYQKSGSHELCMEIASRHLVL